MTEARVGRSLGKAEIHGKNAGNAPERVGGSPKYAGNTPEGVGGSRKPEIERPKRHGNRENDAILGAEMGN